MVINQTRPLSQKYCSLLRAKYVKHKRLKTDSILANVNNQIKLYLRTLRELTIVFFKILKILPYILRDFFSGKAGKSPKNTFFVIWLLGDSNWTRLNYDHNSDGFFGSFPMVPPKTTTTFGFRAYFNHFGKKKCFNFREAWENESL